MTESVGSPFRRRAFLSLSGLPVRLCRAFEVDPLRAAAPSREEELAPREAPVFWDVPVAVGVRPVRIWALALCAGRPPGCPAEASGVAGLRATVVVPPFRIPDERPEAVEEVVGVRGSCGSFQDARRAG